MQTCTKIPLQRGIQPSRLPFKPETGFFRFVPKKNIRKDDGGFRRFPNTAIFHTKRSKNRH